MLLLFGARWCSTWKERAAACAEPQGFILRKISPTSLWFYTFNVGNPPVKVLGELSFAAYLAWSGSWGCEMHRPDKAWKLSRALQWPTGGCLELAFPQMTEPFPFQNSNIYLHQRCWEVLTVKHYLCDISLLPTLILTSHELVLFPFHWFHPVKYLLMLSHTRFVFFPPRTIQYLFVQGQEQVAAPQLWSGISG